MRAVLSGIMTVILLIASAAYTKALCSPPEPGATLIGTFSETILIDDDDPDIGSGVIKNVDVEFEIWMTTGNETVMSFDVEDMEFLSPCEWAETYPLEDMMDEVARDGLVRAEALGYITCSSTCPATVLTKVYYETCVKRDLTGTCPTLVAASGTTLSYNSYSVCCTGGTPSVTLISQTCGATSCGTGYELTCN